MKIMLEVKIHTRKRDFEIVKQYLGSEYLNMSRRAIALLSDMIMNDYDLSKIHQNSDYRFIKIIYVIESNNYQSMYSLLDLYDYNMLELILSSNKIYHNINTECCIYTSKPFLELALNSGDYTYDQLKAINKIGDIYIYTDSILDVLNPSMSVSRIKSICKIFKNLTKIDYRTTIQLLREIVEDKDDDELKILCKKIKYAVKKKKLDISMNDLIYDINHDDLDYDTDFISCYNKIPIKDLDDKFTECIECIDDAPISKRPLFKYLNK